MPDDHRPARGQFQKGRSGNPRGRPKRPTEFDDVAAMILNEKVPIKVGGRTVRVSRIEVLLRLHLEQCLQTKKLDQLAVSLLKKSAPKGFELTEDDEEELRAALRKEPK